MASCKGGRFPNVATFPSLTLRATRRIDKQSEVDSMLSHRRVPFVSRVTEGNLTVSRPPKSTQSGGSNNREFSRAAPPEDMHERQRETSSAEAISGHAAYCSPVRGTGFGNKH